MVEAASLVYEAMEPLSTSGSYDVLLDVLPFLTMFPLVCCKNCKGAGGRRLRSKSNLREDEDAREREARLLASPVVGFSSSICSVGSFEARLTYETATEGPVRWESVALFMPR